MKGLSDPLAYVRTWTQFAVEDVLGRKLSTGEYDARVPAQAAVIKRLVP